MQEYFILNDGTSFEKPKRTKQVESQHSEMEQEPTVAQIMDRKAQFIDSNTYHAALARAQDAEAQKPLNHPI